MYLCINPSQEKSDFISAGGPLSPLFNVENGVSQSLNFSILLDIGSQGWASTPTSSQEPLGGGGNQDELPISSFSKTTTSAASKFLASDSRSPILATAEETLSE